MKSDRIIARLKSAKHFSRAASRSLVCWKIEQEGFKYTEDQSKKMCEASELFSQAETIVDEVYADMIGKQIVSEL